MDDIFEQVASLRRAGQRGVLATIVEVRGSAPREVGARMLVHADGQIQGTVGGGALEHRVRALAKDVLSEGRARLERFDLGNDLGMGCGGFTTVFLEPLGVAHRLLLFGAGHIAEHLCEMAARCGFQVVVCDERDELRIAERFPRAFALSAAGTAERLGELEETHLGDPEHTYVVVVTHSHSLDFALVSGLLTHRPRYLAMVGSRSKRKKLDGVLQQGGATAQDLARVHSPAGIPLGGRSPAEIAVSVLAELVQVRAKHEPVPEQSA